MHVGVIGVGAMGRNHVRVYSELRGVDQVHIYDLDKNRMLELASEVVVPEPSQAELLKNVDVVSICVPTELHWSVTNTAIEYGIPALVEKPFTADAKEALDILSMCDSNRVRVGVGHIERFNPVVAEIQKIVKEPLYVEFKRHNPASARMMNGSIVEDLMIHDIDIVRNVLFPAKEYELYSMGTPDLCTATFRFNSTVVSLSASRKASKKLRSVLIEEEERTIEGDFMSQEVYIYRKPGKYSIDAGQYRQENIIEKLMVNKVEPLREELKAFINSVRNHVPFPVTPLQAYENMKLCEAIKNGLF